MKCGIFIFATLIFGFVSTAYGDLDKDINEACEKRPGFTKATNTALTNVGKALGLPINNGFDRAHVLSFEAIRKQVCEGYPRSGKQHDLQNWNDKMVELIDDLHTIDTKWYHFTDLKNSAAYPEYVSVNTNNKKAALESLDNVLKAGNAAVPAVPAALKKLLRSINSATANLRPGQFSINRGIGGRLDPLLKRKATGNIDESDLTPQSKKLKTDWDSTWKEDGNGGIKTSDNS